MPSENDCLSIPREEEAGKLARAILAFAEKKRLTDTCGCRAFYSPAEWKERGEKYGTNSALIVVHDGGDFAPMFNYDYEDYSLLEEMSGALRALGYYPEPCTSWYTAIYKV